MVIAEIEGIAETTVIAVTAVTAVTVVVTGLHVGAHTRLPIVVTETTTLPERMIVVIVIAIAIGTMTGVIVTDPEAPMIKRQRTNGIGRKTRRWQMGMTEKVSIFVQPTDYFADGPGEAESPAPAHDELDTAE